ncbi:MAG TPA: FtsX-like permease family protein, partial [Corynebacterium sp.]|nr:FtsX-like permease family protein [Corynebacterium sp.]
TDGTGGVTTVLGTDPTLALNLQVIDGDFHGIGDLPGVGLSADTARDLGVGVGDPVEVTSPLTTATARVPVRVIWEDTSSYTPLAVSAATAAELLPDTRAWFTQNAYVRFTADADRDAVFGRVSDEVKSYGILQIMTPEEFRIAAAEQIDQLLTLIYALLALSVVIAVLGIINTLALSIMERTREFGMLRAVGMQQRQIRRMITLESVHIALLGAFAGIVTGVWLGWCLVRTLASQGIDRWAVPGEQLAVVLFAAILVGVVAALWPARRAARTSPLAAVD